VFVSGRVRRPDSAPAPGGFDVALTEESGSGVIFRQGVVTDQAGRFVFCASAYRTVLLDVVAPPAGTSFHPVCRAILGRSLSIRGENVKADFDVRLCRKTNVYVYVHRPDGTPAKGARVIPCYPRGPAVSTNQQGLALLRQAPAGVPVTCYVRDPSGAFAALVDVSVPLTPAFPIPIALRPARTAEVVLRDTVGRATAGKVAAFMRAPETEGTYIRVAQGAPKEGARAGSVKLTGLVPGVPYYVFWPGRFRTLSGRGAHPLPTIAAFGKGLLKWEFRMGPRGKPRNRKPPKVVMTEYFARDLAALDRRNRSKRQDPVQQELVWYVLDGALACADAKRRTVVKYSENFFGYDRITVNGFGFTPKAVLIATDKGLFRYNRRLRYWSRMAGAVRYIETAVSAIASGGRNSLLVTLALAGGEKKRFRYLPGVKPATQAWVELK